MKKILLIVAVVFVFLATGCQNNTTKKEDANKTVVDKSFMTETEQKANKTKQEADELNKELDAMIQEFNEEK
jgi:peptidoglycan hydrolase CwlO-like protein